MGMDVSCQYLGGWIAFREKCRLPSRRGAAVEESLALSYEQSDELRAFILDEDAAFCERGRFRYVARSHTSCFRHDDARLKLDPIAFQFSEDGIVDGMD